MGELLSVHCSTCHCVLRLFPMEAQTEVRCQTFLKGSFICRRGQAIEKILILCQGIAKKHRSEALGCSTIDPGTVLGYQEVIAGQTVWSHSIQALEQCTIIGIQHQIFFKYLEQNSNVLAMLLQQSIEQHDQTQQQLIRSWEATQQHVSGSVYG